MIYSLTESPGVVESGQDVMISGPWRAMRKDFSSCDADGQRYRTRNVSAFRRVGV